MKKIITATLTLFLTAYATQAHTPALADDLDPSQPTQDAPADSEQREKNNAEATVVMKADIDKAGHNVKCRIVSSEKPELDDISLDYCRNEKHRPVTKNGVPVIVHDHPVIVKYHVDN